MKFPMTHVVRLFEVRNGQVDKEHFAQFCIHPDDLQAVLDYQAKVFYDTKFVHTMTQYRWV